MPEINPQNITLAQPIVPDRWHYGGAIAMLNGETLTEAQAAVEAEHIRDGISRGDLDDLEVITDLAGWAPYTLLVTSAHWVNEQDYETFMWLIAD